MSSPPEAGQTWTTPARRGARAYLAGSIVAQGCALGRYTLLARLLGPEQLGLAATLILTQQFFESLSDSGADRFSIQDKDGDTPEHAARTIVWMATADGVGVDGGRYFHNCAEAPAAPQALDDQAAARLWTESERMLEAIGV